MKQQSQQNIYDAEDYLQAMKRFQAETRGMVPHSDEWRTIRNRIYKDLTTQKNERRVNQREMSGGQTVHAGAVSADFSSFFNLLVVVPEEPDCYEVVHVLNYYGFPFKTEEEDFFSHSRKDFGFTADD